MTTPSSTTCSRGDAFFVNVRFSDGSGIKRRPVIVVSVDAVHLSRADALIMPVTTRLGFQRFGDHVLVDWELAGLPRPSMVKGVVETVERSTFDSFVGRLTARDLGAVEHSLRDVLGM